MLEAAQKAGDPATVINIGSIDGVRTPGVSAQTYSYSSSKAALIALTQHLGKDLGPRGITCNLIAPGPFYTRLFALNNLEAYKHFYEPEEHPLEKAMKKGMAAQIPIKRIGEQWDAAGTAIFLMSKAGSFVNGVTISLDGGLWLGSVPPKGRL